MNFVWLKRLRVILSLLILFLLLIYFIDFTELLPHSIVAPLLDLQFVPSFLQFITVGGVLSAGFILIILLTLFAGRIYCSSLCPLGTFQDAISRSAIRVKKLKRYKVQKSYKWLRYSTLTITIILLVSGSISFVLLLDPYSNFGRMASNLVRPAAVGINNLLAKVLNAMDVFWIFPVEFRFDGYAALIFSLVLLITLIRLSSKNGRIFCNTVCPVGVLLGLFSRLSLFRIGIDKSQCTSCGKCSAVCKAGCIDFKAREVHFDRCVSCLNCLDSCPQNGVHYQNRYGKQKKQPDFKPVDMQKRNFFLASIGLGISGAAMAGEKITSGESKVDRPHPVTPPGSKSLDHFTDLCTACHLCVSKCPTHVLQPTLLDYGLSGFMQPEMNYFTSYCNYDCVVCSEVCPTGAILPVHQEEKKRIQLGKAIFIEETCVVYVDETDCGACSEHCPTKAVNMVPYKKDLTIPEVDETICVGCGACEYACPTDPKSIYVKANTIHQEAAMPETEKAEPREKPAEDFPF